MSVVAHYDRIAEWYDTYVRTQPLLYEVVIPAVIKMIEETGDLCDRRICDLACGQGVIARQLAQRGAQVVGIDISERLLTLAKSEEVSARHPITYMRDDAQVASALEDASVDGVVCNMALMDILDLDATFRTVHRVLRSGGWFVFAITHPYVQMHHSRWVTRDDGTVTREAGDYFAEGFWRPTDAPGVRGQVGSYHRTLSTYLNTLAGAHLTLEQIVEPCGSEALLQQMPGYRWVPAAFLARCRKAS